MRALPHLACCGLVAWIAAGCGSDEPARRTEPAPSPPLDDSRPVVDEAEASETARDPIPAVPAEMLALGGMHSCWLTDSGRVSCWGGNQFGQLSDVAVPRTPTASRSRAAAVEEGLEGVVRVVAGTFHTCALRSGGDLVCWGHGGFGQLGDGGRLDRPVPVPVSSLTTVVAVAAGEGHTCARTAERRIWCWGRNTFGQLGDGTTDDRLVPTLVAAVDDVVEVVAGRDHTCARRGDGEVLCWGAGFEGQLGDGERHLPDGFRPQPRPVAGLGVVEALMAGTGHVCARRADTTLACWGDNGAGQLGDGRTIRREPFAVPRTEGAVVVVTGGYFLCGLYGADARCWGANAFGQLGDGAREPRSIPAPVRDLGPARVIGAGARHACAVSAAGDGVWCWGANHRGQAGRAPTPRRLVPGRVEGT